MMTNQQIENLIVAILLAGKLAHSGQGVDDEDIKQAKQLAFMISQL